MKKFNVFFTLLLVAMISFTACTDEETLSIERLESMLDELDQQKADQLVEQATANYNAITEKKWTLKEYQPSFMLRAAALDPDNTDANTRMAKIKHVKNYNMELYFETAEDNSLKVRVDVGLTDEEVDVKLKEFQDDIYPDFKDWGFILGKESTLAGFRRVIAAPLAADNLGIDDITNEETGLCIFSITKRDMSELSYDDVVLTKNKLIANNDDKLYLNGDGTLTIETTSKEYGVSKLIMSEVTE